MSKRLSHNKKLLTKKRFESLLKKAAQPISEWQHGQEAKETSGIHPSDGCIGKRKSQGKTKFQGHHTN